jgi:hypothetical protein
MSVEENKSQNTTQTNTDVGNYDEDIKKYTKIDNLDEDNFVDSAKYFLVSFISPEGVMNCKMRGLKIRTYKNRVTFSTLEEAKAAADEINQKDKYFNVFVGETGKWMGWDPAPDDRNFVEEEKWANKDQDLLMQKMKEKELKQKQDLDELNALVGKKKDIIDKEGKTHKKRVAKALKDSATNKQSSTETSETPELMTQEEVDAETKHIVQKTPRNPLFIKERLRKKLQEKKQQEDESKLSKQTVQQSLGVEVKETVETKTQLDSNIKKLTELLEKSKE